ncbi:MAG: LD-carboxypeptidase [Culturomica sp.]|jgi:muramoyltetrapeptide carboxypeptidase|nr:LD-carboxypeptidase [Culturomica sp.]
MLRPNYLQEGDYVALVSPAGHIDGSCVENATELLQSWGLNPIVGRNAEKQYGFYSGTDEERIEDLQWAMDNDEIKAIFCTRGGYGCMRIVDKLDYSKFQGEPKWVVGFSDITVLLSKITSLGIESMHAPMPQTYSDTDKDALTRLKEMLFGEVKNYYIPTNHLNRIGFVSGELTGGNLCILNCIRSTNIEHNSHNSILFIEDVGENLYAVDRMMQSFKLSGRLEDLQGLIVGAFTEIKNNNFTKDAYELIREAVDEYEFPVCFNFPAGHIHNNYPLIMGASVCLNVETSGAEVIFQDI